MTPNELDAHVMGYQIETGQRKFTSREIADWLNVQGITATSSSVGKLLSRVRFIDPQGRTVSKIFGNYILHSLDNL